MTGAEWLSCDNVFTLLGHAEKVLSARKLRLFGCACCRRLEPWLVDERSQRAVQVAARYADGRASQEDLWAAQAAASRAQLSFTPQAASHPSRSARALAQRGHEATFAAAMVAFQDVPYSVLLLHCIRAAAAEAARVIWASADEAQSRAGAARGTPGARAARAEARQAREAAGRVVRAARGGAEEEAMAYQRGVLRDLLGPLPFHPFELRLSWRTPAVLALTAAIYEEQRFDELPVLADALEESGCDNADLLGHLRGPGPHACGCWAVDLLLQKG